MPRSTDQRREEILRRLADTGFVSAADLARDLGVSEMTIRRDLQSVTADGLGRRVRGGLGLPAGALVGSGISLAAPFESRADERADVKERLAHATADLLGELDGTVIGLDAGTTVAPLARLIAGGRTIVSHSVPVITTCTRRDDVTLVALGGEYQQQTRSFGGPLTRAALGELAIDVAVLSASAISEAGTWSTNSADADTKRSLADAADTVLLVADGSKLGVRAPVRALDLDRIDILVTEAGLDPGIRSWLERAGIRVHPHPSPEPVEGRLAPSVINNSTPNRSDDHDQHRPPASR